MTDHKALIWLLQSKQHNAKLARWASILSQFDFNLIYREGSKHTNADFMSRGFEVESCEAGVGYVLQETLNRSGCQICKKDTEPER